MSFKETILELIETVVVSVAIISLIYSLVASIEIVWGSSMEPNFHTGERILVEKVTKYYKPLRRGEVVVIKPPTDSRHYIKRVIGIPGDIIKIVDCAVYISREGEKFMLDESYLSSGTCTLGNSAITEGRSLRLGEKEYVVLGDNRGVSVDSRAFGVITNANIVGRVVFRFWPLTKFGFIY